MDTKLFIQKPLTTIIPATHLVRRNGTVFCLEVSPHGYCLFKCPKSWIVDKSTVPKPSKLSAVRQLLAAAKQERRIARSQLKRQRRQERMAHAQLLWDVYQQQYSTPNIALAELIVYINRFAKVFTSKPFSERTSQEQQYIDSCYRFKDLWLQQNKHNIISHCISAKHQNLFIDWYTLHSVRNITGEWQDPDDYIYNTTTYIYAYSLCIDDQIYYFHSKSKLFKDNSFDPSQHGSAQPIQPHHINLSQLDNALLIARFLLLSKTSN